MGNTPPLTPTPKSGQNPRFLRSLLFLDQPVTPCRPPHLFTSHCHCPNPDPTICHLSCDRQPSPGQLAASHTLSSHRTAARQSFLRNKSCQAFSQLRALIILTGILQKVFLRDVSSPHSVGWTVFQHYRSLATRSCPLDVPSRLSSNLHYSPTLLLLPDRLSHHQLSKLADEFPLVLQDLFSASSRIPDPTPGLPSLGMHHLSLLSKAPLVGDHHLCASSTCT